MVDAQSQPFLVGRQIVDSVRDSLARTRLWVAVDVGFHELALRPPCSARVLEFAHQSFPIGVEGNRRLPAVLIFRHTSPDAFEKSVSVWVGGSLLGFRIRLKAGYRADARGITPAALFVGESRRALVVPQQR